MATPSKKSKKVIVEITQSSQQAQPLTHGSSSTSTPMPNSPLAKRKLMASGVEGDSVLSAKRAKRVSRASSSNSLLEQADSKRDSSEGKKPKKRKSKSGLSTESHLPEDDDSDAPASQSTLYPSNSPALPPKKPAPVRSPHFSVC